MIENSLQHYKSPARSKMGLARPGASGGGGRNGRGSGLKGVGFGRLHLLSGVRRQIRPLVD